MYNEYEEMAKQAYEDAYLDAYEEMAKQAYEDAYADAYDEVCDAIAKQAEAAEFDDMVKMAYDEICGFEKEALWDRNSLNPLQTHLAEKGISKKTEAALTKGYRNLSSRVEKNQNTIDTLDRARRTMGDKFGGKARSLLGKLETENDDLKRKIGSIAAMQRVSMVKR